MITGKKCVEHGKTSGASANGATSQSGESGSESSSEGSEANSQNVSFDTRVFPPDLRKYLRQYVHFEF
jgi:hypothetical protein